MAYAYRGYEIRTTPAWCIYKENQFLIDFFCEKDAIDWIDWQHRVSALAP